MESIRREGQIVKFQEITRETTNGEVRSTYEVGNLTVHLTSSFKNKFPLEDAMYEIVLQRLRSQKKSEGRQTDDGQSNKVVV
jgi:hypothetical protein